MDFSTTQVATLNKDSQLKLRMQAMKHHRVFGMVRTTADLQMFMQWHVFAVWDFMSLIKRLQRDLTCVDLPWLPQNNRKAARLVNEIVLGEESDEVGDGTHSSHFEQYLQAMREVGADTVQIEQFIDLIRRGFPVNEALGKVNAPEAIATFVRSTIRTACYGQPHEVLGSFFYGREDVIPQMFQCLLDTWTIDPSQAPTFVYYLKRHIELDADSHGPAAQTIISEMLGDDHGATDVMLDAALSAVEQRIKLWDALDSALQQAVSLQED
jgi:hypothetical protein